MKITLMDIKDEDLTVILDKITALRHELHKIPEVSMKEYRTKQEIMDFISDNTMLGLNDCGAWFYAVKKSGRTDLERGNRFPRGHGCGVWKGRSSRTLLRI